MMFFIDSKDDGGVQNEEEIKLPTVSTYESPRFHLEDEVNVQEMLAYLDTHGYAVISNVASTSDIERAKDLFWNFSEETCPNLKRNDISTWENENWVGGKKNASTGIIGSPEFSHSDFSWYGRLLPKCHKAFVAVWDNNEDLLVSFDAGNAYRPWKVNPSWATRRNWWHTDQNSWKGPSRQGKVCIQGLITYYDATAISGGFCAIPGSHKLHDEVCKRNLAVQYSPVDYVSVDSSDPILHYSPAILPLAKAGDLIIWDSRLIHCNMPGLDAPVNNPENPIDSPPKEQWIQNISTENSDLLRLVTYVCMIPKSFASPEAIDSRKLALLQRKSGFHWPQMPIPNVKEYDSNNDENYHNFLSQCSEMKLKLTGYSDEEIALRSYSSRV